MTESRIEGVKSSGCVSLVEIDEYEISKYLLLVGLQLAPCRCNLARWME